MKKILLGQTGIEVTELCFGALPMGPLQKNLSLEDGAALLVEALKRGINFIDTAQIYQTYPYIQKALSQCPEKPVIATKTPAASYEDAEHAVQEALDSMGLSHIDIFLIHAARAGTDVFEQRAGALQCLKDYQAKGVIRAVGISTHSVPVVRAAALRSDMDVVFPILNAAGRGILDGSLTEMEQAIESCFQQNKGVYFMKALGGGTLLHDYINAMDYVRNFSAGRGPFALGMVSSEELDINLRYFSGENLTALFEDQKIPVKRFVVVKSLCKKCGACMEACHSGAITMEEKHALIHPEQCLTCGYCVKNCQEFAIRMI